MEERNPDHVDVHLKTKLKTSVFDLKWTITEFDKIISSKSTIISETFSSTSRSTSPWFLSLKLNNQEEQESMPSSSTENYVSVFINCNDTNTSFVKLCLNLHILNNKGNQCYKMSFKSDSPSNSKCFGFDNFISLETLTDPDSIYLTNNSLNLYAEITLIHFVNIQRSVNHRHVNEIIETTAQCNTESGFGVLYQNADFTDLTVICGDVRILVHKNILASKSEVLYKKLKKLEGNELSIPLPCAITQQLLKFIYTGTCIWEQHVNELYDTAIKLKIPDLKMFLEKNICDSLTVENACTRLLWAAKLNAQSLKVKIIDFIHRNIKHIFNTSDFQNAIHEYPEITTELYCSFVKRYINNAIET